MAIGTTKLRLEKRPIPVLRRARLGRICRIFRLSSALSLWLTIGIATAEDTGREFELNIPRTTAEESVKLLSRQTGYSVIFQSVDVAGIQTNAVQGRFTLQAALNRMLAGTVLSGRLTKMEVITISNNVNTKAGENEMKTKSKHRKGVFGGIGAILASVFATSGAIGQEQSVNRADLAAKPLEEIIVTAQKREQQLQDVPISIAVLDGEFLDSGRFEGVAEALNQVAGFNQFVTAQSGAPKFSVRGVTAGGTLFAGSGTVGYYLDDVPFGLAKSAITPNVNSYDLARVEALRGPQGTLYGASALNGVIRILTNDADLEKSEFKARTLFSSTDGGGENYRGDFATNLPIIQGKLAARLVVGYSDMSGWIDRVIGDGSVARENANDSQVTNVRLKVGAQPFDNLKLNFSVWSERVEHGMSATAADNMTRLARVEEPLENDVDVYGLTVTYDFPAVSLVSSTNYLEYSSGSIMDIAGIDQLFTGVDAKVFTQELRLHSTAEGTWHWTAGLLHRDAEDPLLQTLPVFLAAPISWVDKSESIALFGEVERSLLNGNLTIAAGLRYFQDDVTVIERIRNTGVPDEPLVTAESTFDSVSPRVTLTYQLSDEASLYGVFSQGFRSGFDQNPLVLTVAPDFPPVQEDTLDNYEVGAKGTFLGGRLVVDAAFYYLEWKDLQQSIGVPITSESGEAVTLIAPINGDTASGMGLDFSATLSPIDDLLLSLQFGWNDITMDTDVISSGVVLFDKGDRLNDSPEYTAGLTAEYGFDIGDRGYFGRFSASANYHSELLKRSIGGGAQQVFEGDEMLLSRVSFSIDSPRQNWSTTLYLDNAANEDGAVTRGVNENGSPRVRPRTFGLQVEFRY